MGKRRLESIRNIYVPNEKNLNPNSNEGQLEQHKREKKEVNYRKVRNQVYHRFMRLYKGIMKQQNIMHNKRIFEVYGRIGMPFGYWKMWIVEGVIGPEEDKEGENFAKR